LDKETGVTEEASPASEVQDTEVSAVTEPVSSAPGKPDRPVENLRGEFDRKFSKLQEQQAQMLQYLATLGRQPQTPQPVSKDVSDDDLWALAQGGDRQAFELWTERKADKRIEQRLAGNNQQQLVENQLRTLTAKYPILNDPSNPLTQTAHQAYQLMVQNGYAANRATLLDAVKTAIAERPDIISDHYTQNARAADQQRQSASRVAQSGQTGVSHRAPAINKDKLKISPEEEALAKRMGIKDPLGAKKRFLERNEKGLSNLGAVGALVDQDGF
jgi:hypothetical protein